MIRHVSQVSSSPAITVAMLVRDREQLLEASARSVLAQSERDLELVIVDDGSRDGSWEVASAIAASDDRVRLLRNEQPRGIPAARNQVLEAARGRFLATLDSDDLLRPDCLARERARLEAEPQLVGVGASLSCFTHEPEDGAEPGWHWGVRDGRPPFPLSGSMLRTEAVREVGGFDERYPVAEDIVLCYRLAARGGRFAIIEDAVLADIRIHSGSITSGVLGREWHLLRAHLLGLRLLRGRLSPSGYARVLQTALRVALAALRLRR